MRLMKLVVVCLLALWFSCNMACADTQNDEEEYKEYVKSLKGFTPPPKPIYPKYSYDITAHSNCVLENGKNARTPRASSEVSTACRHKATPKKCRDVSAMPPDNESKSPQEICVDECKSAGMWSRKYGDCSLD